MENITKTGKTFHEKKKKNQENPKLKGSKAGFQDTQYGNEYLEMFLNLRFRYRI